MVTYAIVCLLIPVLFVLYQYTIDTLAPLSFYLSFDLLGTVIVQVSYTVTTVVFFKNNKHGIYRFIRDILMGVMAILVLSTILTLSTNNNVTTLRQVDASNYYINIFLGLIAILHLVYGILLTRTGKLPFTLPRSLLVPKDDWENSVVVTGQLIIVTSILLFIPPLKMMSGTYIEYSLLFMAFLFAPYMLITFDLLLRNNKTILFNNELYDPEEINLSSKTEIFETKGAHYEHINKEIRKLHGEEQWFKG